MVVGEESSKAFLADDVAGGLANLSARFDLFVAESLMTSLRVKVGDELLEIVSQRAFAEEDVGFNATTDRVHVHDLHATILHLLGFDHTRLTFRFQGRDFRLTDVHGNVVKKLLA